MAIDTKALKKAYDVLNAQADNLSEAITAYEAAKASRQGSAEAPKVAIQPVELRIEDDVQRVACALLNCSIPDGFDRNGSHSSGTYQEYTWSLKSLLRVQDEWKALELAKAAIAAMPPKRESGCLSEKIDEVGKQLGQQRGDDKFQKLFWRIARVLKCLPSCFADGNEHVFRAAEKAMSRETGKSVLREALQFYADGKHFDVIDSHPASPYTFVVLDKGEVAKKAITDIEGGK